LTVGSAGLAGRLQSAQASVTGTISGTAYTSPAAPSGRFGVGGVRVDVYDTAGTYMGRTTTAADGTYSLKIRAATAGVRVRFTPPDPYVAAPEAGGSTTPVEPGVRFLTLGHAPATADVALVLPNQPCRSRGATGAAVLVDC
jgi:hypothetical protein